MNYKRDTKSSRSQDVYKPKGYDLCQTPPYALTPLLPHLFRSGFKIIWEPAAGEGYLVKALESKGFYVVESDVQTGQNFFDFEPVQSWQCLVTNPPYSIKYKWIRRCYELGNPFALLMPVETLGAQTGQKMFDEFGLDVILLNRRVDFKMPNKGWSGGGAQFPVAWFTWGLNIQGSACMTFAELDKSKNLP